MRAFIFCVEVEAAKDEGMVESAAQSWQREEDASTHLALTKVDVGELDDLEAAICAQAKRSIHGQRVPRLSHGKQACSKHAEDRKGSCTVH